MTENILGIDPGFTGALGLVTSTGRCVVWDMPVLEGRDALDRQREINLPRLHDLFVQLRTTTLNLRVGVEWPTTRPGEGAERSERFGRQKGLLEGLLYALRIKYEKLSPQLWKGRLGLPGKTDAQALPLAAKLFDTYYPGYTALIRGPRGGILGGRVEALLIAHYLRVQTLGGIEALKQEFGTGSVQMQALMLGGGRQRRGRMRIKHIK